MPVLQNLYQIYKLPSTKIVENNLNITDYTKLKAIREGALVSIGDNLLFHKIRDFYGDKRSHIEIFNQIQEMRQTLKKCKREGKIAEARIVNQCITDTLFVKDVINVQMKRKGEYSKLKKGFYVNGVKYIRFSCGAGQLRRNTATFVNEQLVPYLEEALMCGLNIKEFNLAKLSAYFALSFSSVMWVRTPRVCVIKDFETTLPKQKLDYIYINEQGEDKIEEREMDITLNSADGQGLIDPEFAALWAKDMHLDYVPSSFIVRSAFMKGNVVPFDFKLYAQMNGIDTIIDRWGTPYKINDIDVLISESQFKMYKLYSCWEEYLQNFKKYNLKWGVARYNRKYDDEWVLANYQYIQVLKINREDIKELISPTIQWLNMVCSGSQLAALLFLLGTHDDTVDYTKLYGVAQSNFAKAVVKNSKMLEDGYVRRKIYRNIVNCINRAKIGKIWVRGNYQFMISDPVAQCQSALGLPPLGLVPAKHVYSNFWNERGVRGEIDLCRSPLVDKSEHNKSRLFCTAEAQDWYRHIKSGVIYSLYDIATITHSDSDWDGDLVMSTNNAVFLRGAQTQFSPITYEKGTVPLQKNTMSNRVKTDLRGFGTAVGSFSNCTTIIEAMKAIFNPETQQEQIQELTNRQKLLRRIIGQEIDSAKGVPKPKLPSSWKKFVRVYPDDDDAIKAEKYKHNSMVICKKPYFFRYLYPELNKRFKQYENAYNVVCKDMFGLKLKKLMAKIDKTEAEKQFVRRYQKFSPLIVSNCTMNILCREFESLDFDIKFNDDSTTYLPLFEDAGFEVKPEILKVVKDNYRRFNNKKAIRIAESAFRDYEDEDLQEIYFNIADTVRDEIQEELYGLGLSPKELMFYIGALSKEYKKFNWGFAWEILDKDIVDLIPQGKTFAPVRDENGEEWLGEKYVLKDVTKQEQGAEQIESDIWDETIWEDLE